MAANPGNPSPKMCWKCGKKPRQDGLCTCHDCLKTWGGNDPSTWLHWNGCIEPDCAQCDVILEAKPWLSGETIQDAI